MSRLRPLIPIIACLVGACFLGWRSIAKAPPKQEQLTTIEGVVRDVTTGTRSNRYNSARYPVIRLEGHAEGFKYLDWFPQPRRIYDELKAGDRVRLLSDTPDGDHWVWQVEKDGRVIVSYAEIHGAVQDNRRYDPYLAIILGAVGLFGFRRWRRSA